MHESLRALPHRHRRRWGNPLSIRCFPEENLLLMENGPTFGPFARRSAALAAERGWLERHLPELAADL
ncbi:hypothetical protein ACERK3_11585 [Phycisphaerales bacterium AB-hyl4]|uniref:Uncharacterized protein n=1 Tax=Natronomicrosphaera hydrolytica TaxID=3242702 RepID=A0ABV4U6Y7_9BACT